MKWILLGAVLGLLIAYPSLGTPVASAAAALAGQPVVVAFALGLLARPVVARRLRKSWSPGKTCVTPVMLPGTAPQGAR